MAPRAGGVAGASIGGGALGAVGVARVDAADVAVMAGVDAARVAVMAGVDASLSGMAGVDAAGVAVMAGVDAGVAASVAAGLGGHL